jgi:hypothetical protein
MAITMRVKVYDSDGEEEVTHTIPAKWEICSRCEGSGSHVNPSIDGHGITSDEWNGPDWDDESRETYMSGGYDVACEAGCQGGKVLVPDPDGASAKAKEVIARYQGQQEEEARDRAADARTLYMESGGSMGRW